MRLSTATEGLQETQAELQRLGTLPAKALAAAAVSIEDFASMYAALHNKSGALVRSLVRRQEGESWVIGHDAQHAPHAVFVHWGTKPHRIEPRNKGALRFVAGGRFAFAKGVNHPGYKGDAYFARAAAMAPHTFERHLRTLLDNPPAPAR